jgi:hypothetical protein
MDTGNVIVVDFQRKPKRNTRMELYEELLENIENPTEVLFLLVEEDKSNQEVIILNAANNNGVIYVG